jgi:DNA-binding NtrC family response regulator
VDGVAFGRRERVLQKPSVMDVQRRPSAPDSTGREARLTRLFEEIAASGEPVGPSPTLRHWLDAAEAWRIREALAAARGNRSAAARALGIGRRTLYAKMEKHGIRPVWASPAETPGA